MLIGGDEGGKLSSNDCSRNLVNDFSSRKLFFNMNSAISINLRFLLISQIKLEDQCGGEY